MIEKLFLPIHPPYLFLSQRLYTYPFVLLFFHMFCIFASSLFRSNSKATLLEKLFRLCNLKYSFVSLFSIILLFISFLTFITIQNSLIFVFTTYLYPLNTTFLKEGTVSMSIPDSSWNILGAQ